MKNYKIPRTMKSSFLLLVTFVLVMTLLSCEKEKTDPVVQTTSVTGLSINEYFVSAKIPEKGDYKILDYGFMYLIGYDSSNYYNYKKVSLGSTIQNDTFSAIIETDQSYYYNQYRFFAKAYVTNEKGTIYGNIVSADLVVIQLKSIFPTKAKIGDTITLNGNYFNKVPSLNHVYFSDVLATVISGTITSLRVIVPYSSYNYYYGNPITISVQSGGDETSLSNVFTLQASASGFTPNHGSWGNYIEITGYGLYDADIYFDDVFIVRNTSTYYCDVTIPSSFLKKNFKIHVIIDGENLEVPGGYFNMDPLVVNEPYYSQFSRGNYLSLYGQNFNPSNTYSKLLLGNYTVSASGSYSSSADFYIPYNFQLGTYVAKVTNGIDTVTLANPITIVAK